MKFDIETDDEREERQNTQDKNKIYVIIILAFVLVAIIVIITAISLSNGKNKENPNKPLPSPKVIVKHGEDKKEQKSLKVVDEDSGDRPIAVMIDNAIGNAYHAGLQDSYLNYEILVEGGITRIMAIYKDSKASLIGPVRSARHYFLDYALESDAIYAHYGWSPYAKDDITKLSIDNIDGLQAPSAYRRDTNSKAPHNVFTRMSYLRGYLDTTPYSTETDDWQLLNYSVDPVDLNDTAYKPKSATKIIIPYSKTEQRIYSYDDANEYYLRSQNNQPHLDRSTKEQLHYKNIIIERVPSKVIDSEGRLELTTTGKGRAYIITNGYFLPITWSKETRESKTVYTYADGSDVIVNDGNTFIQVVPVDCNITIE